MLSSPTPVPMTPSNSTLGVLLGNGDATFRPVDVYASGAMAAASVVSADMDADGAPDLVVGNSGAAGPVGSAVTVLLATVTERFQPAVGYGDGGTIRSIAIADLNADTNPDVAVANRSGDAVDVLTGMATGPSADRYATRSGGVMATASRWRI